MRIASVLLPIALAGTLAAAQVAQAPRLLVLPGDIAVRYSPGSLDRATSLQERFTVLVKQFAAWNKQRVPMVLLLLNREEWESSGVRLNYGLPGRLGGNVLVVSAWGDPGTVQLWEGLLGRALPQPSDTPIRGSAREVASLMPGDMLAEVEAARMMLETSGVAGNRPWIPEVMAHSVVISNLLKNEPWRVSDLSGFYATVSDPRRRLSIDDYRSGLSLEDWLWFQGRFFEAAAALAEDQGAGAAKGMLKLARKKGNPVTAESLLERYPSLRDWVSATFPGAA